MKKIIHKHLHEHKNTWSDKTFVLSVLLGLVMLATSFVANYYAGVFATMNMSNPVTDLLLSKLPELNFHFVIMDGIPIFLGSLVVLSAVAPKRIPFIMKSMALFVVVRACFLVMTHIAPYPDREVFELNAITSKFFVGGELFFSGHTGMPFLMALAFWEAKRIRWIFLAFTVIAATSVLFSHVHYSIDVFAAPFITYSIFVIAKKFFAKDYKIFMQTIVRNFSD